jgi:aspartate/methionine/tyrosine aminotransferase
MSGLRLGAFYTHSNEVLKAMKQLSMFGTTSGQTQFCIAKMLEDDVWLQEYIQGKVRPKILSFYIFIAENRRRLKEAYETTTSVLKKNGIPYIESHGGLFLALDLRQFVRKDPNEDPRKLELEIFTKLVDSKVLVSPGLYCIVVASVHKLLGMEFHFSEPGYFRLVFTEQKDTMKIGLQRLVDCVAKLK